MTEKDKIASLLVGAVDEITLSIHASEFYDTLMELGVESIKRDFEGGWTGNHCGSFTHESSDYTFTGEMYYGTISISREDSDG